VFVDHDQFRVAISVRQMSASALSPPDSTPAEVSGPCARLGKHLEHVLEPTLAGAVWTLMTELRFCAPSGPGKDYRDCSGIAQPQEGDR